MTKLDDRITKLVYDEIINRTKLSDGITQYIREELVRELKRQDVVLTDDQFEDAFKLAKHRFIIAKGEQGN